MSGLDVEKLLDETTDGRTQRHDQKNRSEHKSTDDDRSSGRRRRDDSRDRYRDRGQGPRDRSRDRYRDRQRSRSRDRRDDRGGGRYRGSDRDRRQDHYRPHGDREDRRDPRKRSKTPESKEPRLTEDERDKRTVFIQQLSARLRTKQLIAFFEQIGPVKEAQIVKDRVSGRSKGVGYVEFKDEESVPKAIQLTGQKLCDLPIIVQLTEAEKNRQARNAESTGNGNANSVPFHRLYVGNIHFSITEGDLQDIFASFGELEFVQLQTEEGGGRSRGYGFVQFKNPGEAKEALEQLNGFELAGRSIRVGLGNDKFTPESTANLMQRFQSKKAEEQAPSFSGYGGRGAQAGGSGGSYDRGARDNDKAAGAASALDDADVGGVNFSNFSRDSLMRKLAREDDDTTGGEKARKDAQAKAQARQIAAHNNHTSNPSRCIRLRNCFDPAAEEGTSWVKELEDDVKDECNDKYGHVVHIHVDQNTDGDIYLKFDRVQGGENAIKGLNGRFFGGRVITAQPVVDAIYRGLFPQSANY